MQAERVASDELDIVGLVEIVWHERVLILAGVAIALALAMGRLWLQPVIYQAALEYRLQTPGVLARVENLTPQDAANEFALTLGLQSTFVEYFQHHPGQLGCPDAGDAMKRCVEAAHGWLTVPNLTTTYRSTVDLVHPAGIDGAAVLNAYTMDTARTVFQGMVADRIRSWEAEFAKNETAMADLRLLRDARVAKRVTELRDAMRQARALGIARARFGEITAQTGSMSMVDSVPAFLLGTEIIEQQIEGELRLKDDDLLIDGFAGLKVRGDYLRRKIDDLKSLMPEPVPVIRVSAIRASAPVPRRVRSSLVLAAVAGAALAGVAAFIRHGVRERRAGSRARAEHA